MFLTAVANLREFVLRMVHERLYPAGSIDQFGGCNNVLSPTIFHIRQEAQSSDFSVSHTADEEDQGGSVFSWLTYKSTRRPSTITIREILQPYA